jgi:hypothetical protein
MESTRIRGVEQERKEKDRAEGLTQTMTRSSKGSGGGGLMSTIGVYINQAAGQFGEGHREEGRDGENQDLLSISRAEDLHPENQFALRSRARGASQSAMLHRLDGHLAPVFGEPAILNVDHGRTCNTKSANCRKAPLQRNEHTDEIIANAVPIPNTNVDLRVTRESHGYLKAGKCKG